MTVIAIPKILQERLTNEGAEALLDIINKADADSKETTTAYVEERFERRLAQTETSIIRWMFIFWVGQIGVLTGILFAFFRK